ncbi:MAG: tetratricopeptide repeat protein [Thermodesulfobacteriota bacterium]
MMQITVQPTQLRLIAAALIGAVFLWALSAVAWRPTELFLTPDQKGRLQMARKNYSEAADRFEDPLQRGTALYLAGDFKRAAGSFTGQSSAIGAYNRANSLIMLGNYDAAIEAYLQALTAKPGWPEAEENLALARARKEKLEPADDDAGGTGGKMKADEIVFDNRQQKNSSDNKEQVSGDGNSDQAMWLRRVQTKPADFLRVKFSYQAAVQAETGLTK